MICVFLGRTRYTCNGRLQDHHVIPQQAIKSRYKTMRYMNVIPPMTLAAALADKRNQVTVCFHHHINLLENARIHLERKDLPDGIDKFAEALGLGGYMARHHPHQTQGADQ